MINAVQFQGNLTRDVEMRFTPNGTAVATIGLANNRKYKGKDGQVAEEVTFVDIQAFGKTAEMVHKYFQKGAQVLIEGRLQLDQWDDKQTGQKRSKLKIVAEKVHFCGGKRESQSTQAPAPEYGKRPVAPVQNVQRDPGEDLDVPDDNVPFHHERSAFWSRYETRQP